MNLKARAKRLKDNYNLTPEEYDRIAKFQRNCCFVCNQPTKSGISLATDHRHSDGLVRGLLCQQCNRVLGKIEDPRWKMTPKLILRIAFYLLHPPAETALGKKVFGYPGKIGTKKQRAYLRKAKKHDLG